MTSKMLMLYPDQQEIVDKVRGAMKKHRTLLLQSPTGSGKTAMAIYMLASAYAKGKKAMFQVPRRELLRQTSESFHQYGILHSFCASAREYNPYARTYLAMMETLASRIRNRPDLVPNVDLLFIDEAHFGASAMDTIIGHYRKTGAWIVGLSATPWKLSGQGLGCWYDHMVPGKSIRWLIDNKRLSDYRYFIGRHKPDLSGVKVTAGDYNKKQLSEVMEHEKVIIGDCVGEYRDKAMGRLHVVRCTSVRHSQEVAAAFNAAGIPAAHVDGTTPDDELKRIIMAYARREILVLTFCELLNFGFDLSQASGMDVCIESCSDLRPSKSLAAQMQYWGRVLRMKDYPALIFDHVNNYSEHGLPCADRNWTLEDRRQGKRKTEPVPPTKQCPNCFHVHTPAPSCPECNHVYTVKSRKIDEVEGELEEISPKELKRREVRQRKFEQSQARTLGELIELGYSRGMKNPEGWAAKVMAARMKKSRGY